MYNQNICLTTRCGDPVYYQSMDLGTRHSELVQNYPRNSVPGVFIQYTVKPYV